VAVGELAVRIILTVNYPRSLDRLPKALATDPDREILFGQLIKGDPNPRMAYRMRPGARGLYAGGLVRINEQGFRDDPVAIPKPPNTLRVIGLGDSTMFGLGVKRNECYMDLLEAEFQSLLGPDRRVEFVNTAAPAYNTVQEAEMFLTSGPAIQPDAVLIQYDNNDLAPSFTSVRPDFLRARHSFVAHPLALSRGLYSDIYAFFLLGQVDRLVDKEAAFGGWDAVEDAYRRLAAACDQRAIPILGMLICEDPAEILEPPRPDPDHERILKLWDELSITPIHTRPTTEAYLRETGGTWIDIAVSERDPHPNRIGHALIARAALPALSATLLKDIDPASLPPQRDAALGNVILRQLTGDGR
jgi:hypothetical protein